MADPLIDDDDARRARLDRMKRLALLLLLAMAVVFAWTFQLPDRTWVGYLRAFSEAAMIGALADWFAVTALFRHPLGVPIPHTAIVPRRKDQIARSLGRFVADHFLVEEVLRPRLAAFGFAARIADWLERPGNAEKLTADGGALLRWLARAADDEQLRSMVSGHLHLSLREVQVTPLIGRVADLLVRGPHAQILLNAAVVWAREVLDENRGRIRDRIGERSPWWLPGFVDERIYASMVAEVDGLLDRVGADEGHPARQRFNQALREGVARLSEDPEVIARGEAIKRELLEHPAVEAYLAGLWNDLRTALLEADRHADGPLRRRIVEGVRGIAAQVRSEPALGAEVDAWAVATVSHLVTNYRDEIATIISETVRSWDPELTAERLELQVGRDLQFIRINGTLVGGAVGLIIHAIVRAGST